MCNNINSFYSNKWLENPIKGILFSLNDLSKIAEIDIPRSLLGFVMLRHSGIPYRLLINETTETHLHVTKYLKYIGFEIADNEDIVLPTPIVNNMRRKGHQRPFLNIHDEVLDEILSVDHHNKLNGMAIGDGGPKYNYYNLNRAHQFLTDRPGHLFALGKGKYFKTKEGFSLNINNLTKALEISTGTRATIIGEPPCEYYLKACKDMELKPKDVIMLSVDLKSIKIAQNCGIRGILMKTDKYMKFDRTARTADGVVLNLHEAMMLIINYSPRQ